MHKDYYVRQLATLQTELTTLEGNRDYYTKEVYTKTRLGLLNDIKRTVNKIEAYS